MFVKLNNPKYRVATAWLKSIEGEMVKAMPWPLRIGNSGTMANAKFVENEGNGIKEEEDVLKLKGIL